MEDENPRRVYDEELFSLWDFWNSTTPPHWPLPGTSGAGLNSPPNEPATQLQQVPQSTLTQPIVYDQTTGMQDPRPLLDDDRSMNTLSSPSWISASASVMLSSQEASALTSDDRSWQLSGLCYPLEQNTRAERCDHLQDEQAGPSATSQLVDVGYQTHETFMTRHRQYPEMMPGGGLIQSSERHSSPSVSLGSEMSPGATPQEFEAAARDGTSMSSSALELVQAYIVKSKDKCSRPDGRRDVAIPNAGLFICTAGCGWSTSRPYDWRRHEESRQPQTFYICVLCSTALASRGGYPFINHRIDKMKDHIAKMHDTAEMDIAAIAERSRIPFDAPFERHCPFQECEVVFANWSERVTHITEHFRRYTSTQQAGVP